MSPTRPDPPYPPHPTKRLADGRPLPARPATLDDHHDHRHFPFTEADAADRRCSLCPNYDPEASVG